jgi:hypothetical protein
MPRASQLFWFEKILKGIPVFYPITSIVFGAMIWLIFLAIGNMMELEWDNETRITILLMGIVVAFQLMSLQYLSNIWRNTLAEICNLYANKNGFDIINIKEMPHKLFWYYAMMLVVILPFYLIDWISPNYTLAEYFLEYYSYDPSNWSLLFDIYKDLAGLLVLFLFFNILWILTNMAWTIRSIGTQSHGLKMNANIFAANRRLGAIRDSLLKAVACYFICVSLIIASYVDFSIHIYETAYLILFLAMGLVFFLVGSEAVNSLMKGQIALVSNNINEKIQEYLERLLRIESDGDPSQKIQETNFVSNMLDVLQKQRESLAKESTKVYDLRSVFSFSCVFFLPIITDLAKKELNSILASGDVINQGISALNSIIQRII